MGGRSEPAVAGQGSGRTEQVGDLSIAEEMGFSATRSEPARHRGIYRESSHRVWSRRSAASLMVYHWCMARTNVDVDDEACAVVMRRYRLATKREAVNFALRSLASEPFSVEEARRMRGTGWDGDLDEMRGRVDDPR